MTLKLKFIGPMTAIAFALTPALAGHPSDGAEHKAGHSSDDHAEHCAQGARYDDANHKDHASHNHEKGNDGEDHDHECEDRPAQ